MIMNNNEIKTPDIWAASDSQSHVISSTYLIPWPSPVQVCSTAHKTARVLVSPEYDHGQVPPTAFPPHHSKATPCCLSCRMGSMATCDSCPGKPLRRMPVCQHGIHHGSQ